MPDHTNRLIHEASPYLLQHAHNPVEWYPWGPEALLRAKTEDKPILLSIGYSACHWCHVMERESFEDEAIAKQMNGSFVCIKVDREERPDLDHLYQLVVQLMGRSGGWPLTVFLTPEQRPFFGGTYFPPSDRHGMPGLPRVLAAVSEAYRERREEVSTQAQELTSALGRVSEVETRGAPRYSPGPDLLERTSRRLFARFDERNGGFGAAPKFPSSMCLEVLLRRAALEEDDGAAARVKRALVAMSEGGIFDQLAGGFHRYSTDAEWLVPHFEKMLYDNALLLRLYVDAYRAFGDDALASTASDIGTWLLAEMQSPDGGFYATLDADSEGEEGKFYVFSPRDVEAALAGDALAIAVAKAHFGITREGNFEDTGASVLHVAAPLDEVAKGLGEPREAVEAALERAVRGLLASRSKRVRPFRDEKVLAGWNGLVIGALADASMALREPSLLAAAERAFAHVERALVRGGRVERLTKDGVTKGPGFLDDHAFVARAALDLYEATGEPRYLERARAIADELLTRFWDEESGGFFFAPSDGEALLCRAKDPFDQATPSGGSIAALVLLVLGGLVNESYAKPAERQLEQLAPAAAENPFAFGQTVCVLDRLVRGATDVVVVGPRDDPRTLALVEAAFAAYLPNRTIVRLDPANAPSMTLPKLAAEGKPVKGVPVAYVCRQRTCSAPVETAEELGRGLG